MAVALTDLQARRDQLKDERIQSLGEVSQAQINTNEVALKSAPAADDAAADSCENRLHNHRFRWKGLRSTVPAASTRVRSSRPPLPKYTVTWHNIGYSIAGQWR